MAGERLQNLGLCSALREGSLSCRTCCDMGPRVFRSHSKDRPNQSLALKTHIGMWRIYSSPDPNGVKYDQKSSPKPSSPVNLTQYGNNSL
jgi:hypothetical protein